MGSILRFCYDDTECFCLDSTCFATGHYIKYLVAVLNSPIGHYLLKDSPQTGTGDLLVSVQALEPIYVHEPNDKLNTDIIMLLDSILICNNDVEIQSFERRVNELLFAVYGFTEEEIVFIENSNK